MKWRFMLVWLIVCVGLGFSKDSFVWGKKGIGIYESGVRKMLISPINDTNIYVGTSKALYKSTDSGKSYRLVLRLSGETKSVNDIYIAQDYPEIVYAATDAGLYESLDKGETWKRIYFSSDEKLRQCLSVIRSGNGIYLGTQRGLFYKSYRETQWDQIKEGLDDEPVYHIAGDDQGLYFSTGQAVFRQDEKTKKVRKIFSLGIGREIDADNTLSEASESEEDLTVRVIATAGLQRPYIFAASTEGIFFSFDKGEHWQGLRTDNLALNDLTSLLIFEHDTGCLSSSSGCLKLMAGTKKGVFFFNDGKWTPVYKGIETNGINHLAKDSRGTVYAATDKGIFYLAMGEALPFISVNSKSEIRNPKQIQITKTKNLKQYEDIDQDFSHEPGINEVHQMAIDYAEVSPEKIKAWRRQARLRAWLPDLDIGADGDRDWSSSDSIWGSYSGGGQHYVGPDDKTRGEDIGWDVSLSWDLADLVWSTDQTTIDSRSKLMVELREDILNEVTRLYFERRRVQVELALDDSLDLNLHMDKKMRVAELTALIDALTGGEFSRKIGSKEAKK